MSVEQCIVDEVLRRDDAGESVMSIYQVMGIRIGVVYAILREHRPDRKPRPVTRTSELRSCIVCGTEFETKLPGRYTCSREHSRLASNARTQAGRALRNPKYAAKWREERKERKVLETRGAPKPARIEPSTRRAKDLEAVCRTDRLGFKLTPQMNDAIRKAAKEKGQKPSEYVRQAIRMALDVTAAVDTV